jgi:hypothetical protein
MEILLRGSIAGQETINRWNYLAAGTPAAVSLSFALTAAFGFIDSAGVFPVDSVFRQIDDVVNDNASFAEAQVRAIYNPTDFYTRPFDPPQAGKGTGECMPPFIAMGFRTNRVTLAIRRGTKRIAGVNESAVGDNGVYTAGGLSGLTEVASRMSEVITYDDEGNTLTFTPVVVQREKYTTPSGKSAYRYYATESAQADHLAQGITWSAYGEVRGQSSRQYGRGR